MSSRAQSRTLGRSIAAALVLILLWLVATSATAQEQGTPGPLRLYFLNVGQGDGALLVTPDGVTALIDGGDIDRGEAMVAWLRSIGVNSVDWVMPSHPHADHMGGLNAVLEQMEVRGALVSDQTYTTEAYRRQMQLLADKQVPITRAEEGATIQLGAYVTAQVLSPPPGLLQTVEPVEDNSVILRVCVVVICTLFTGDVGDQGERWLLARYGDTPEVLRSQILKVSHHGSAEPNDPRLLALIQPEIALIGVGAGNSFGHPTQRALDRLGATGATIYRTDLHGTILVEILEDRYGVSLMPELAIASSRRAASQPAAPTSPPADGARLPGARTGQPVRYDPNGPDRDCGDFSTWAEAQDFYEAAGGPARDPHRLDSDRDGIACETLPGAPRR